MKNTIVSFSQEREDVILYHLLNRVGISNIRWIDIGANDPLILSVTKLFSLWGGYGINVEPQPVYIELLKEDRPYDTNVQVGISDTEGTLRLYGDGTGATFEETSEEVDKEKPIEVSVMTLTQMCDKYWKESDQIHFLKIDVEGWEKQCLSGMDFKKYRPWVICMESAEPGTDIPAYDKWEYILMENDYDFLGSSGINRYYGAKERISVLNEFKNGEQLDEFYHIMTNDELAAATETLQLLRSKSFKPFRLGYRILKRMKNTFRKEK